MKKESLFNLIFLTMVITSFYLFFRIISPFLAIIAWGAILAIIFYPPFVLLARVLRDQRTWAALLMTIAIVLVIVIPVGLLLNMIARELLEIYKYLEEAIAAGKHEQLLQGLRHIPFIAKLAELLDQYFDLSRINLKQLLLENLQGLNAYIAGQAPRFIKGVTAIILEGILTAVTLFFLFKDGALLIETIRDLIPLSPRERERILKRMVEMIQATIYGGLVVALVQGGMGALGFVLVGLGSPIFWGVIMALLSFMHIVGPFMVWVPAAIYLLLQGSYAKAIFLGIWGGTLVSLSDNVLRPLIISGKTQVHPLLVFFSILGGLHLFGLVGFIAGPLVTTCCLAIIDIYTARARRHTG